MLLQVLGHPLGTEMDAVGWLLVTDWVADAVTVAVLVSLLDELCLLIVEVVVISPEIVGDALVLGMVIVADSEMVNVLEADMLPEREINFVAVTVACTVRVGDGKCVKLRP
eukprot:GDKJ01053191.1.p2 GENE.GDKJ01053191.1~~GDKJ01053191.1.p2  ORF type:complete len:111 (-),score=5.95 GDKJ01053191.1:96-428(-)